MFTRSKATPAKYQRVGARSTSKKPATSLMVTVFRGGQPEPISAHGTVCDGENPWERNWDASAGSLAPVIVATSLGSANWDSSRRLAG